jgi:hypothetical protein
MISLRPPPRRHNKASDVAIESGTVQRYWTEKAEVGHIGDLLVHRPITNTPIWVVILDAGFVFLPLIRSLTSRYPSGLKRSTESEIYEVDHTRIQPTHFKLQF